MAQIDPAEARPAARLLHALGQLGRALHAEAAAGCGWVCWVYICVCGLGQGTGCKMYIHVYIHPPINKPTNQSHAPKSNSTSRGNNSRRPLNTVGVRRHASAVWLNPHTLSASTMATGAPRTRRRRRRRMGLVGFLRLWSRGPKTLLGVKWGLGPVGSRAMLSRPSRREGQRAWSPLLVRARLRA